MGKIELDYQNALTQARQLENAAADIDRMLKGSYSNAVNDVSVAWKSDSAAQFITKTQEMRDKMRKTSEQIKNLADAIKSAAKKVYDAEKRAEEIARNRSSGNGSGGGAGGGGFR